MKQNRRYGWVPGWGSLAATVVAFCGPFTKKITLAYQDWATIWLGPINDQLYLLRGTDEFGVLFT